MAKINWQGTEARFKNMIRRNNYVPLDAERTIQVMKNSMFMTAPHSTQPIFEKMFGKIDQKFLTPDIKAECSEFREKYSDALQIPKILKLNPKTVRLAVQATNDRLGLKSKMFKPSDIGNAALRLPTTTSSVAPDYITPKIERLASVIEYVKNIFTGRMILPEVKDFWPITIFWRTQMRAGGERHRIIAGFPQVVSLLEMIYFKPFFEHFEDSIGLTWYSYSSTWVENSRAWLEFQKFTNVIELDYTRFDITVAGQLLHLFYDNCETFLEMDTLDKRVYHWVRDYHMHAVVLNSRKGKPEFIDNKLNSVLSGSVVTNFADSWINVFIISYIMIELGIASKDVDARVMGDDVILANNEDGEVLLKAFEVKVKETFQMEISDKSRIVEQGKPFFYMGFLTDDNSKLMSEELLVRKLIMTGRFIPETLLEKQMVVWSKYCSLCACCSNGYSFWLRYKPLLLKYLEIDEPYYFHDLTEGPNKPFDINRIINNAHEYVQGAWRYT